MHKGIRYRLSATILMEFGNVSEQMPTIQPAKAITIPNHIKVLNCDNASECCKDFFKRISVMPHKMMQDNVNRSQVIFFPLKINKIKSAATEATAQKRKLR